MKRYSNMFEAVCTTADKNPGNELSKTGVTNHYTPIENIVTNIRNLFALQMGIVTSVGEDGVSLKLNSSTFDNEKNVYKMLYKPVYQDQSIYSYVTQQGLDKVKLVNAGQFYVVYFYASDIKSTEDPATHIQYNDTNDELEVAATPCEELQKYNIEEAELSTIFENDDDDEELSKIRNTQVTEIINSKDKIKAAKQFATLIATAMSLPTEYYFTGVKSKDGDESIALRWKYIKRRPHNKSMELTRSLINIFGTGKEAVWVADFDKDCMFQLPDDVKKLIENVLDFLDAEKTNDPCIFSIEETKEDDKKTDKKDDDKRDDDKKDDNKKDDDKKDDSEDVEAESEEAII